MPRLNVVEPAQATGEVKKIYDNLEKAMGKVINIFQGMGNSEAALNAYLGMSATLKKGHLSPEDREVVYITVSQANGCNYCLAAHTGIAKTIGMTDEQVIAIRKMQPEAAKHQALGRFVQRVMETKGFVENADLQAVRDAGYNDGQIAETIAFIGLATYSNYFNHVFATELDFPAIPEV
ncbi:MAG: carboxymuconolactone decarboxylase family protein [Gemmataceae bacterium]